MFASQFPLRVITPDMESKREEFRKYLEKGGALQALSDALSRLYEEQEKPPDPLAYIAERLQSFVDNKVSPEEAKEVTSNKSSPSTQNSPTIFNGGICVDSGYEASPYLNGVPVKEEKPLVSPNATADMEATISHL